MARKDSGKPDKPMERMDRKMRTATSPGRSGNKAERGPPPTVKPRPASRARRNAEMEFPPDEDT